MIITNLMILINFTLILRYIIIPKLITQLSADIKIRKMITFGFWYLRVICTVLRSSVYMGDLNEVMILRP